LTGKLGHLKGENKMSMPGFTAEASLDRNIGSNFTGAWIVGLADVPEQTGIIAAAGPGPACSWWGWIFFPVACDFVLMNMATGTPGDGVSKCTAWQIPFDFVGCNTV
jgi:hypothetical protein